MADDMRKFIQIVEGRGTPIFEAKIAIPNRAKTWLENWNYGCSGSVYRLTPAIVGDLRRTVIPKKYRLFRSWKFQTPEIFQEYFKVMPDSIKRGSILQFNHKTPTSWTTSGIIARKFADPRYSTQDHVYYDDDELIDMGYDYGDLLGVGLRAVCVFEPQHIFADFAQIKNVEFQYDEKEVIVAPGNYAITVLECTTCFFRTNSF